MTDAESETGILREGDSRRKKILVVTELLLIVAFFWWVVALIEGISFVWRCLDRATP